MQSPTLTARTASPTYFELNNQLNIPKDGRIQLDKDKEAVRAYFLEYVNPNTVFFHDLREKLDYLLSEDYIMESFAQKFEYHQQDKRFHPFTCGNDACNQTHAHAELYYDELFDKLRCHYCDYEQDVPDYLEELLELL